MPFPIHAFRLRPPKIAKAGGPSVLDFLPRPGGTYIMPSKNSIALLSGVRVTTAFFQERV